MSKNTSPQTSESSANVTIVDGKLILSLPNAKMPVVWQMDLEHAQASAFTVQEDKKAKTFTLSLKKEDGAFDEIAAFEDKQTAVDTLMETSNVLQNAHGQIKPAANSNSGSSGSSATNKNDRMGAGLAIALIVVLGLIWMMSASRTIRSEMSQNRTASPDLAASMGNPSDTNGVPVSADDFLNNR